MKHTRAWKKADLLAHAEAVTEELLDRDEEAKRPNLRQIDEVDLSSGRGSGEWLAEVVTEGKEARQSAEPPPLSKLRRGYGQKVRKGLDVEGLVGALDLG